MACDLQTTYAVTSLPVMDRIKNVVLQVSNRMGVASSAQEGDIYTNARVGKHAVANCVTSRSDCEAPRHTEHTAVDSMHQKQQTQSRSESLPQGSVCTGTTDIADTRIWKPEPAPRSKPVPSGSISYESPSNEHVKEVGDYTASQLVRRYTNIRVLGKIYFPVAGGRTEK